jgi:hypothetical protein
MLAGGSPNGTPPEAFGEYRDLVEVLVRAHATGGTPAIREAWNSFVHRHPVLAALVSGDSSPPERKIHWTADELLQADFPEPKWVVPGIFPEGLMILAGRPKIGKSVLTLQLAHAVLSGGMFLNQHIEKAPVLYIAFEDSARRLKKRMREQEWPEKTQAVFYTDWPPLDQDGLAQLQQAVEDDDYHLVIIDTLSRALSRKPDQNSVGDMTHVLSGLQRLAMDREIAILVIDHHGKPRGANPDPIDDILGSTGKGAVADCIVGLYREQGKKGAILRIVGRDLDEDKNLVLDRDPQLRCWQLRGRTDEVRPDSLPAEILRALDRLGEASLLELAGALEKHKGSISRGLDALLGKGLIESCGKRRRADVYRRVRSSSPEGEDEREKAKK